MSVDGKGSRFLSSHEFGMAMNFKISASGDSKGSLRGCRHSVTMRPCGRSTFVIPFSVLISNKGVAAKTVSQRCGRDLREYWCGRLTSFMTSESFNVSTFRSGRNALKKVSNGCLVEMDDSVTQFVWMERRMWMYSRQARFCAGFVLKVAESMADGLGVYAHSGWGGGMW